VYFFYLETSSLNIFYSKNGEDVLIATAVSDLPGPRLHIDCHYPKERRCKIYSIVNCKHEFIHLGFQQIRSGDEAPTSFFECVHCKMVKSGDTTAKCPSS
jgi:DNA-directed RNA polymerase subunit M/transcription elongation factor TFIIS